MNQTHQTLMTQKAILQINLKVDIHTSDKKKRKVIDTTNSNLQQTLLSNRSLLITTTMIDPHIDDRIVTSAVSLIKLMMPQMTEVIIDLARTSAWTF